MISDDWKQHAHHHVIDHHDYTLSLEEYRNSQGGQMMFIDLGVRRWSASMAKHALSVWTVFRKHITCPLYAFPDVDDPKWEKFVRAFGFEPLLTVKCTDGSPRRMFWHSGK